RDPLVGRDLLIGALFGIAVGLIVYIRILLPGWLGWPPIQPFTGSINSLLGINQVCSLFFDTQLTRIAMGLCTLFLLLFLYMLFRREWLAVILLGSIYIAINLLEHGIHPFTNWFFAGLTVALIFFVLRRFGLLAMISMMFFVEWAYFPYTSDFSVWYSG